MSGTTPPSDVFRARIDDLRDRLAQAIRERAQPVLERNGMLDSEAQGRAVPTEPEDRAAAERILKLAGIPTEAELMAMVREEARAIAHETALALWLERERELLTAQAIDEDDDERGLQDRRRLKSGTKGAIEINLDVPTLTSLQTLMGDVHGVSLAASMATLEALLDHWPGNIDSQAVYEHVGRETGLKDPRQAAQRVMRALRDRGLIMGGGKGSGTWLWSWPGSEARV